MVLHHEIGNHGWLPFYEELAKRFTVYVPSCPGFGKSDRPEWARNVRDIASLHQWLLNEMKLEQEKLSLLGLGWGGWLAAEMATMSTGQFKKMVLVGPVGVQPTEGEIMDQFLVASIAFVRSGFHDQSKFDEIFGADPDLDLLEQWEIHREMTTRVAWKPYMFNQALPHLLPSVTSPTLLVWGKEDKQVPLNCGKRYLEALPNARMELLEQCGHYAEIEKPDQLAKLSIDFLAGA